MARRKTNVPLNVYLNGKLVGKFRREQTGAVDFQYDASWLDWDKAIPVSLSLPLREDRYIGASVMTVFENLLPDNADILRQLAERTGADGTDAYSLLSQIGRDCVGALQFLPDGVAPSDPGTIDARKVSDAKIAAVLENLPRNPLGIDDDDAFRISIAGAQEKTALLLWKKKWYVPHGTTATTHILKPQLGVLPNGIDMSQSVENEHFCMRLIAKLGLPAAQTKIADFDGRRVLVVERFDRHWTKDKRLLRVPQEDCCQALSVPPTRKYQSEGGPGIQDIAELLKGSDDAGGDRRRLFKIQALFWLLAATDGHAKNFSLRLSHGGRFNMTPLYDVMSAQPAHDANQIRRNQFKLAMGVGTNRHYVVGRILPRHFIQTANACGMPVGSMEEILDELADSLPNALDATISDMPDGFPAALFESIRDAALGRIDQIARAGT